MRQTDAREPSRIYADSERECATGFPVRVGEDHEMESPWRIAAARPCKSYDSTFDHNSLARLLRFFSVLNRRTQPASSAVSLPAANRASQDSRLAFGRRDNAYCEAAIKSSCDSGHRFSRAANLRSACSFSASHDTPPTIPGQRESRAIPVIGDAEAGQPSPSAVGPHLRRDNHRLSTTPPVPCAQRRPIPNRPSRPPSPR